MQRLPNTPEGETKPIGFRLPPPMLAMIDREVDALRAASPEGASVTRSTALRALLVELEQRRAADPTSTPAPPLPRASLARIVAAVEGAGAELRGLLEEGDGGGEVQRGDEERRPVEQVAQRGAGAVEAEGPRAGGQVRRVLQPVAHTAAGGQLSLLTRTANDGAQHPAQAPESQRPHRATNTASAAEGGGAIPAALAVALDSLKPRLVAAIAAGHSAKAIGRVAGVDPASLTRWVSGARSGVSERTARALGAYLPSIGF